MFKLKYIFIAGFMLSGFLVSAQSGFVNNGMTINVEPGAYINVQDYTNNSANSYDGSVNLDGTFILTGNITNNSAGPLFVNIEASPDGNIIMNGSAQSIQGTTAMEFENLDMESATKTLNVTNCDVKGILNLNSILDLNSNRLILSTGAPSALNFQSGYILSETLPSDGLGEIEWRIGGNTAAYTIPFGTGSGTNDLNVTLTTLSSASPNDGSVVFATYPADAYNDPLPGTVFSLDPLQPKDIADRYWEISPNFSSKPDFSLLLDYNDPEIDQTDNPGLIETNLKLMRYNDFENTWTDMPMTGTCDLANNTITTGTIPGSDFYSYWVIGEFEVRVPNAFNPGDNNGINDIFMKGYHVKIFNRWDQIISEGDNGWDGTYDGKSVSPGTYFYELTIPDVDNTTKLVTGAITVVSK